MMKTELPVEIVTEILTQLPVKSLTRFKCVSKPWKSLISSPPSFINHHIKQTLISNPNPNPNIVISHHSLVSALITDNNNHLHFSELSHPLKLLPTRPKVGLVESCNGILLICDYPKTTIFLYNPGNNTYRLLPPMPSQTQQYEFFGLGYDSHTDDYKVIRVFQTPDVSMEICVYSMRENVWKLIKDESVSVRKYYIQPSHGVGLKGVLYFLAVSMEPKPVLLCFDVRTEAFSVVDYPELDCYDYSKLPMVLRELCGYLCLLVNYQSKSLGTGGHLLYSDAWEMREGSWVKLLRIRKSEIVGKGKQCRFLRIVAYSKDKRKVLVEVDYAGFGWYDLLTKKFKRVKTPGLRVEELPYAAMTC